jgi:uncharacterized repeat protein (TIGR03803 family)
VFKLNPTSGKETVLYSFTGGADGGYTFAGLIRDGNGNFYGTASAGGDLNVCSFQPGCGVVFKLDPAGRETVLHTSIGLEGYRRVGPATAERAFLVWVVDDLLCESQ